MEKPVTKTSSRQSEMTLFFKKSYPNQKDDVAEEDTVKKTLRKRKTKDSTKISQEKLPDGRSDKEKTDIRSYFGKNVTEVESSSGIGSNVFSFMMATRHKQDEAIQEMQARELNEAEELLPNIMKSIPKEQLLANFISKAGKKTPEYSMLVSSEQKVKTLESNISMNINSSAEISPLSEKVIHSVLSGKRTRRNSKSVSFSKSVETIEIVKQPDEHTWEFIMDSELNRKKELQFEKTVSNLCNYGDDLDVNVIFKDEIEECMNGGKKRKKPEGKPKTKVKPKNCSTDNSKGESLILDKENIKCNNGVQLNITNFFLPPNVKHEQSNINFQSEFQKYYKDDSDGVENNIGTDCKLKEIISNDILVNDCNDICSQLTKVIKNPNKIDTSIGLHRRNNLRLFRHSSCEEMTSLPDKLVKDIHLKTRQLNMNIIDMKLDDNYNIEHNNDLKTSRDLCEDKTTVPVTLRRSLRLPKKRQLNEIGGCFDDNSSNVPCKKMDLLEEPSTPERSSASKVNRHKKKSQDLDNDSSIEIIEVVSTDKNEDKPKKKLASIFMKKESKANTPKICSTVSKARHDFLFADTPVMVQNKQSPEEQVQTWPPFPLYNHIRQISDDPIWSLPNLELSFLSRPIADQLEFSEVLNCPLQYIKKNNKLNVNSKIEPHPLLHPISLHNILYHLKAKNPQFPVFSIFNDYLNCKIDFLELFAKEPHGVMAEVNAEESSTVIVQETPFLSKRKRPSGRLSSNKRARSDDLSRSENAWQKWIPYSWTQVFAPKNANQVIENGGVKFQLKEWLEEWKNKGELEEAKDRGEHRSKKGDYADSDESDDELVNTVLLSGLSGVGKTSLVYALGQELGIKVLEINASVRRQGRHIMTQLSEATQSHSVSGNCSLISPLRHTQSPSIKSSSKKGKSKNAKLMDSVVKEASDSNDGIDKKKKMVLILFEDIDIVFEDYDEGFMSAVSNFMATTKRPIILTCSQPLHSIRAKIRGNFIEAEMKAPSPATAANYLQLMCLANGVFLNAKEVEHLLTANRGDIRKSILELQFWALSGSSNVQWLKMEKSKLMKTPSSEQLLDEGIILSDIFPNLSNRKSADVPISNGCMWAKPTMPLLSAMHRNKELLRMMHWSHIDGNLLTLMPFSYKVTEKKKKKYPLSETDPAIKNAYDFHKYSWLVMESEMDQFRVEPEVEEKKIKYSSESNTASIEIMDSLANLFNVMCDLDVLEGHRCDNQMRCSYLTPLDDTSEDSKVSLDNGDLISALTSEMFIKENDSISKCLNECNVIEDCLKATLSTDTPSILFEPHMYRPNSATRPVTELDDKIAKICPLFNQSNPSGVTLDYLPFIRTVARQDQLGNAMRKFKRGSRYLSHLKMMGYYLSQEECTDISNFLI